MYNEIATRKFNKFLNDERENPRLKKYIAKFVLTVTKSHLERDEAINFIRSIPNVTTVTKEAEGINEKDYFKALFSIKFVLEPYEDLNTYVFKVLKKYLQSIKGIRVNSFKGVEKL